MLNRELTLTLVLLLGCGNPTEFSDARVEEFIAAEAPANGPPAADLLLDHPVAVQDRSLLEKLASLPVYQGDPYAEPRARAQALLAATP